MLTIRELPQSPERVPAKVNPLSMAERLPSQAEVLRAWTLANGVPASPSRFRRFATKPLRVLAFGFNR